MDESEFEALMDEALALFDVPEDPEILALREAEWDEMTRDFLDLDSAVHKDLHYWGGE